MFSRVRRRGASDFLGVVVLTYSLLPCFHSQV